MPINFRDLGNIRSRQRVVANPLGGYNVAPDIPDPNDPAMRISQARTAPSGGGNPLGGNIARAIRGLQARQAYEGNQDINRIGFTAALPDPSWEGLKQSLFERGSRQSYTQGTPFSPTSGYQGGWAMLSQLPGMGRNPATEGLRIGGMPEGYQGHEAWLARNKPRR